MHNYRGFITEVKAEHTQRQQVRSVLANYTVGQIQSTAFSCNSNFIWTQPHSFIYTLSVPVFLLQEQRWTVAIKSTCHAKLKIFTIYLHSEKKINYRPLGSRIRWCKKEGTIQFLMQKKDVTCVKIYDKRGGWRGTSCGHKILLLMLFRYNFPFLASFLKNKCMGPA